MWSDFKLGERIWRKKQPTNLNLALFFKVLNLNALWAFSPDTLTQIKIWAHSGNIPHSCLWLDTLYGYVRMSWNFHFFNWKVKFPANCKKKIVEKRLHFFYIKGIQIRFYPICFLFQLISPKPTVHQCKSMSRQGYHSNYSVYYHK